MPSSIKILELKDSLLSKPGKNKKDCDSSFLPPFIQCILDQTIYTKLQTCIYFSYCNYN